MRDRPFCYRYPACAGTEAQVIVQVAHDRAVLPLCNECAEPHRETALRWEPIP